MPSPLGLRDTALRNTPGRAPSQPAMGEYLDLMRARIAAFLDAG
jgi:hypothetical protein